MKEAKLGSANVHVNVSASASLADTFTFEVAPSATAWSPIGSSTGGYWLPVE